MPPERSVHHYAGENRPTLRMPFAQLRELVTALIEPGEAPASEAPLVDAAVELHIDTRPACDRFAEGTLDSAVEHVTDQATYRLTVTATNDRGDCAFVVDSPAHPTTDLDRTAQDAEAFTRTDHAEAAIDELDAIDVDLGADGDDDTVDDFEAQPTAYRVRTAALDTQIATLPPR
jgi:hypothetical protein